MMDRISLIVAIVALTALGIVAIYQDDRTSFSLVVVAIAGLLPGATQSKPPAPPAT